MSEELKQLILDKRKEGKLVHTTIEGFISVDISEFIKQPADGILYDLNRLEEVVLTFIDDPKWLNDFAVALTIRALKTEIEALRKSEDYYKTGAKQTGKQAGRPLYVPKRISIPRMVRSDVPGSGVFVPPGEYDAHVNQYGAVSVKLGDDEFLGIMLYEFDVLEWQENPALREKEEVR